jgi:hypothetical protein
VAVRDDMGNDVIVFNIEPGKQQFFYILPVLKPVVNN